MKRFSGRSFCNYLTATLLTLSFATTVHAQEVKVPFLFSEDDNLDQTDLRKTIPKSRSVQDNSYLNAPMTRLEYMLTQLEAGLNSELPRSGVHHQLSDAFEYSRSKLSTQVSVDGFARYSRETGRITVGYKIEHLGRAKKPMRNTCDEILFLLEMGVPQENYGYLMHNTVLGVLAQEDYTTYTPVMETLAKSIVHRVMLQSQTEDTHVTHGLTCQRTGKGAPIQYYRYSFKLP